MLIKTAGIIIVILSCSLAGLSMKYRSTYHVKELSNLQNCLDIISKEINYSLNDIIKSFEKTKEYASEYNYVIFDGVIKQHSISNGEPLSVIWNDNLTNNLNPAIYNKEDIETLKIFGNLLGIGDVQIQNDNINKLKDSLDERIKFAQTQEERVSVFGKLGIYAGAVITILLF